MVRRTGRKGRLAKNLTGKQASNLTDWQGQTDKQTGRKTGR